MTLSGKKICVTGGNGTLGRAVASKAASLGAAIVLMDVTFENDNVLGGENIRQVVVDLADAEDTRQRFDEIAPLDGLVNTAGGFSMGKTVYDGDQSEWDFMFRINVSTALNAIRAAVPHMISNRRGTIVNIGAIGALSGLPQMGAYTASKSTVMRLTESLSGEVKEKGINVNAVLPSVIDTPPNREGMPDADPSRWVAPGDLANVICFLSSDAASAIHGALIPVAGLS